MKSEERHELERNALAEWMYRIGVGAGRYSRILAGGAVLAVVGFALEGLMWLAIIGIILFVGTIILGFIRRASVRRRTTA